MDSLLTPMRSTTHVECGQNYAQLVKIYGAPIDDDHKYSPSKIKESVRNYLMGKSKQ